MKKYDSNPNFEDVDELINKELKRGSFPGAVLAIIKGDEIIHRKAFGFAQLQPEKRRMTAATIFDLASLTKVIATTTSIMQLVENGVINLWDYLSEYFPEIPQDKKNITIYNLLTHTSGFQAIVQLWKRKMNRQEKIEYILELPLEYNTGEKVLYSDPNFILLGELVERASGKPLDKYAKESIFEPLEMKNTRFNPLRENIKRDDIAATEWCEWRNEMIVGKVHDENAASFNGVSGHAGLFSNIDDLFKFVRMLIKQGYYKNKQILHPNTVKLMAKNSTENLDQKRGLGWNLIDNFRSSGGVLLSQRSYGHTGFTGTSIWIDPLNKIGIVFLTNRVHPSRDNTKIISLRPRLHNLIARTML